MSTPPNADRRSPLAHEAIIKSTLRLLAKVGYASLTIEGVTAGAGVGKATVYRWWPSKAALVAEALASTLVIDDPPETGDFRGDLIAAVEVTMANYLRPHEGLLISALAADIADDPALLESFRDTFIRPRRDVVAALISRGVEDGQLPADVDPELVMDMWAGALLYRGLFKLDPVDDDLAEQLVDAALSPSL